MKLWNVLWFYEMLKYEIRYRLKNTILLQYHFYPTWSIESMHSQLKSQQTISIERQNNYKVERPEI